MKDISQEWKNRDKRCFMRRESWVFSKQVDLAADRKAWENLTDVRLDDLEFATAWNEKSPMHVAIEKGHVECAQYILSRGKGA